MARRVFDFGYDCEQDFMGHIDETFGDLHYCISQSGLAGSGRGGY
jgi:hypothetical protein